MHSTDNPEDQVRLARIGKPHGIRGEVTVQVFTDEPDARFAPGNVVAVRSQSPGAPAHLTVSRARWNKQILVLGFQEISDRNGAEALRGSQLFGSVQDRDDDDSWYEEDLLDLEVHVDGRRVGVVTGLLTGTVQDLLQVAVDGQDEPALVPFVEQIVPEVDVEAGVVVVTPPPGLLAVNAPDPDEEPGRPDGEREG